ncbi:hypothetical protein ACJX0J_036881, partial [Zea mays]
MRLESMIGGLQQHSLVEYEDYFNMGLGRLEKFLYNSAAEKGGVEEYIEDVGTTGDMGEEWWKDKAVAGLEQIEKEGHTHPHVTHPQIVLLTTVPTKLEISHMQNGSRNFWKKQGFKVGWIGTIGVQVFAMLHYVAWGCQRDLTAHIFCVVQIVTDNGSNYKKCLADIIIINISISLLDGMPRSLAHFFTSSKLGWCLDMYLLNDTLMLVGIIPITYLHSHFYLV